MTPLLQVNGLRVEFRTPAGPINAVNGVSFRVLPGSSVAMVGESGSGKSVTAQAILGILPRIGRITSGEILFSNPGKLEKTVDLAQINPSSAAYRFIRGCHIAMVFQEPMTSLSQLHTVGDQISEALHLHRSFNQRAGREATYDMLRMVGFADPARAYRTYPFELSGGLRQRAMIAMALICRPALLIADEPSTALDVTVQAQILKLIQDLRAELGMALLLITHDLGVVANMADEIVVLYGGRVVEAGMADDLFADPRHPYLRALLDAVPRFNMKNGERLKPLREVRHQQSRLLIKSSNDAAGRADASAAPLLEVRSLTKSYGIRNHRSFLSTAPARPVRVVDDVSFSIPRGSCFGLVGESGCGKTTVSKIILRAITPDSGEVFFTGNSGSINILDLKHKDLIPFRRKLQYVFQDPFSSLNPRMTIFDVITEPLVIHDIGDRDFRRTMAAELMDVVGLDRRFLRRYPHSFSGGQRQRICIARALALKPDLLILDEPVSALDVSIQAQILNLLKDLQKELKLTYLFISHNLAVVDYMADRIAVMCAGRIVEEAPRETLFSNPMHPYTRALLAAVPYPDRHRRLDFGALMDGRASIPAAWPKPFTDTTADACVLVDVGNGHRVRLTPGAGDSVGKDAVS